MLDFQRLRVYLRDKYSITKSFLFIGYLPENQSLYKNLQDSGYILIFKPTLRYGEGHIKGNVDAELVLHAMIEYSHYEKALVITGDGDFYCLVDYFNKQSKLLKLLVPNVNKYSKLLNSFAPNKLDFMNNLRNKLEHKKREPIA
ncbi:MAG: NYN domain-containing protein [Chlamydiae bacterium]|nr:NYN domain-containing protein [Chlamydiota bacterium]MBI3277425.1 NYN domain-containing protein [Chlamydiota bacterium]